MAWFDELTQGTPSYNIAASENAQIRVIAGPGTGKSFAMKRRVARLLEKGVSPNAILPVTFTRVAAEDLHRELVGMNVPGCESLKGTTLHSLAMRILMRNHVLASTGRTPRPLNDFELAPLRCDLKSDHHGLRKVDKAITAYQAAWARLQVDEPGYTQSEADASFEEELLSWLRFHHCMLIGEVVPLAYRYLQQNPAAPEREEFTHILVDEYQDLNKAEQRIVDLLSEGASVCIVGDDDQSIYSFKHAHPDGIRTWLADHPQAEDHTLGECHRCPTTVVAMANSLIAQNVNRPEPKSLVPVPQNGSGEVYIKQYQTLESEVDAVVNLIEQLIAAGTPAGDILVLAPRTIIGTPIYESLLLRSVPAKSYYSETELDQLDTQERFARLKLFADKDDRVALRWLLGIGNSNWRTAAYCKLRRHCEASGVAPWEALERLSTGELRIPYTGQLITRFLEIKTDLQMLDQCTGLNEVVDELFPDSLETVRDLRALALETLLSNPDQSSERFVSNLTTAIAKPEIPTEISDVRIMSLHKSKGLSSPVTIICGCIEGVLPKQPDPSLSSDEQIARLEEQRRLFYVGITRVKAKLSQGKIGKLFLTNSKSMPTADAMGSGIQPASSGRGVARFNASRFLAELGREAPSPTRG